MNTEQQAKKSTMDFNLWLYQRHRKAVDEIRMMFRTEIVLTIHNREQFYACVKWCNKNLGHGKQFWTTKGRMLRYIDPSKAAYNPPRTTSWYSFVPGIDLTPLLSLCD